MRHNLKTAYIVCILTVISFEALSQLTSIRDFEGENFDTITISIIPHGDSLYILTKNIGDNDFGSFFRINTYGLGYTLIKSFENDDKYPLSAIGNDTVIYGTTKVSKNGHGKLFRYTYKTGVFEYLKEFLYYKEGRDMYVKYITDSIIWGYSLSSFEDTGSVFTINLDGTSFTKIYNNTNPNNGFSPTDICIINDEIFISFIAGGGIPYNSGGLNISSGSVGKVDLNGENYTKLIRCDSIIGTNPISLVNYDGKIYGLFNSVGSVNTAKLFNIDYDGTNFNSLITGWYTGSGRGKLIVKNDSIFGITSQSLFGYDVSLNSHTVLTRFTSVLGEDAVVGPIYGKNAFFIATQQGGANGGGGSILKFSTSESLFIEKYTLERGIMIYPNPTTNFVNISQPLNKPFNILEVYNIKGSLIIRKMINKNEDIINLQMLNPGLYYLKLIGENTLFKKIIVN